MGKVFLGKGKLFMDDMETPFVVHDFSIKTDVECLERKSDFLDKL